MLAFTFSKRLRDFTLRLSLEVGAETYALVGHSGCGKTTALKILAGLLAPDEGHLTLNGRVLVDTHRRTNIPPEDRNVGYLVQSYALFPHLSVANNVAYGLFDLAHTQQHHRVEEALGLVGARHLARALPGELSGGEQQRVALARALARRPDFLLLDEPLSALDVSTRAHVRAELAAILGRLDIPSIVVTHDYEDARVLADRIAVLDRGKIVQTGTAEQIARTPANPFVAAFTGTNLVPGADESGQQVACDPWRVLLARQPTGATHEWQARVRNVTRLGPFDRVRLDVGHGASLFADLPLDTNARDSFHPGDEVYASVADEHARFIPPPASGRPTDAESTSAAQHAQPPLALRRRGIRSKPLAGLLAVLAIIVGYAGFRTISGDGAPAGAHADNTITALVAANMTEAFDAVTNAYTKRHGHTQIEASYAGTQILFTQLQQGAPADLFISADLEYAERAKNAGLIDRFQPVSTMRPVIIVPKHNPAGIRSLKDLADKPRKLVIGVDNVPIGKYTRQVLKNADADYGPSFSDEVMGHVVSMETDTKQVTQKAATGAADAAIVYRTDITPNIAKKVDIIEIPAAYNETAKNYAAVLNTAENAKLAKSVIAFLRSPEGQNIVRRFHYDTIRQQAEQASPTPGPAARQAPTTLPR